MQTLHDFFHLHINDKSKAGDPVGPDSWASTSEILLELENKLEHSFTQKELLLEALIHPSVGNELPSLGNFNYQRLEFLGDSVLGLILSHELYLRFPNQKEGELSKMKAYLAGQDMVSRLGESIQLEKYLIFSKGARENILKNSSTIGQTSLKYMCDSVEAILAAAFVDKGFPTAYKLFQHLLQSYQKMFLKNYFDESSFLDFDPKTRLQEKCMELFKELPAYNCSAKGVIFECELRIQGKPVSTGQGGNKKDAEKSAAKLALEILSLKNKTE